MHTRICTFTVQSIDWSPVGKVLLCAGKCWRGFTPVLMMRPSLVIFRKDAIIKHCKKIKNKAFMSPLLLRLDKDEETHTSGH